jgi:metal-dependent amidase/aminoacylase/carboxypeptidase family protein
MPAEEGIAGAKASLEDGLFKRFPCDSEFVLHRRLELPIGKLANRPGRKLAGGEADITVTGKGSHGAPPKELTPS